MTLPKIPVKLYPNKGGCLRLVEVDTSQGQIIYSPKNGSMTCGHGSLSSEFKNNLNLCGQKVVDLEGYFPKDISEAVQLHSSCTISCDQTKANDKYYRCNKINAAADISRWFTDSNLKENRECLTSADDTVTVQAITLDQLTLPNLETASHLKFVNNSNLKEILLPKLNSLTKLTVLNNPQLTKIIILVTPSDMAASAVECYQRSVVTDADQFGLCTVIKGPLELNGLAYNIDPKDVHVREIEGCVTVKNTQLTNLDFLAKVKFTKCPPGKQHILEDNPELCLPSFLTNVLTKGKWKTSGCGAPCKDLTKAGCTVFDGNLVITSSTAANLLTDLEIVSGSLMIDGTNHISLDFPKLLEITATKAPGLRVTNNAQLKSLKMPKLATITVPGGGMQIEISGNPLLTNVNEFVPAGLQGQCTNKKPTKCFYQPVGSAKPTPGFYEQHEMWIWIGSGVVLAIPAVVTFIWCYCYREKCCFCCKKKIAEKEEELSGEIFEKNETTVEMKTAIEGTTPDKKKQESVERVVPSRANQEKCLSLARTQVDGMYDSKFLKWFEKEKVFMPATGFIFLLHAIEGFDRCYYELRSHSIFQETKVEEPENSLSAFHGNIFFISSTYPEYGKKFPELITSSLLPTSHPKHCNFLHIGGEGFLNNRDPNKEHIKAAPDAGDAVTNEFGIKSQQIITSFFLKDYNGFIEMNEIKLPEHLPGNLKEISQYPWYEMIFVAWKNNMPIHTNVVEYLYLIHMFLFTLEMLYRPALPASMAAAAFPNCTLWEKIYKKCKSLFNLKANSTDIGIVYIDVTLRFFYKKMENPEWFKDMREMMGPENQQLMDKRKDTAAAMRAKIELMEQADKEYGTIRDGLKYTWKKKCQQCGKEHNFTEKIQKTVPEPEAHYMARFKKYCIPDDKKDSYNSIFLSSYKAELIRFRDDVMTTKGCFVALMEISKCFLRPMFELRRLFVEGREKAFDPTPIDFDLYLTLPEYPMLADRLVRALHRKKLEISKELESLEAEEKEQLANAENCIDAEKKIQLKRAAQKVRVDINRRRFVCLLHIGTPFLKLEYLQQAFDEISSMEFCMGTSQKAAKCGDEVYKVDEVSQQLKLRYVIEKTKYGADSELTEIELASCVRKGIKKASEINWYALVFFALGHGVIIHTDVPEYYQMIRMVKFALEVMLRHTGKKYNKSNEDLWEEVYSKCKAEYNPDDKPIDAWFLWLSVTMDLFMVKVGRIGCDGDLDAMVKKLDTVTLKELKDRRDNLDKIRENMVTALSMNGPGEVDPKTKKTTWTDEKGNKFEEVMKDNIGKPGGPNFERCMNVDPKVSMELVKTVKQKLSPKMDDTEDEGGSTMTAASTADKKKGGDTPVVKTAISKQKSVVKTQETEK